MDFQKKHPGGNLPVFWNFKKKQTVRILIHMWRKLYQEKLREMEQNKENIHPGFTDIPVYVDSYSDEDFIELDDSREEAIQQILEHQERSLRKRKREEEEPSYNTIKKRRPNEMVVDEECVEKNQVALDKVLKEIKIEDTPTITMMRQQGYLGKDEKVIGSWVNPNSPSDDLGMDTIFPSEEYEIIEPTITSAGEDPDTEDDDTIFIKKIELKKASEDIPPPQDEDIKMEDKYDSHILSKDKNRRIVIKKKK